MASLSSIKFERKISCQQCINVRLSMMPGHGANPIFFNKKNKGWTSRTVANPSPNPLSPTFSHFCLTNTSPTPLLGWTSYVYHPWHLVWYAIHQKHAIIRNYTWRDLRGQGCFSFAQNMKLSLKYLYSLLRL